MSQWKKVKLGEICEIKSGKRLPKGTDFANYPTEFKYIRARDIKNGQINGEDLVYITSETREKIKKYIVNTDDIVITIVGASVGDVAYVPDTFNDVNLTENAVRLTNFQDDINSRFIFYVLNSSKYHELMSKKAGGAAQPKLGIYKIEDIEIFVPNYEKQNNIAQILSRYDSLIENYQRQIKLLEEAAQRLYKDWFVDLHFPGYENTKIVDGVPEGWEKNSLSKIIKLYGGYAFKSSEFQSNGSYKIVTIKNVKSGFFDGDNVDKINIIPPKMPDYCKLKEGDILLSLTGIVGRVCFVIGDNYLLNQRVAKLSSKYKAFTYCLFRNKDMSLILSNLANGVAQQNLSPIKTEQLKILIPSEDVLLNFEKADGLLINKILNLHMQIHFLAEARDRLLPKLMSGEIEV